MEYMEESIELKELLNIIIKRKKIIAAIIIVAVLIGGFYSLFIVTPVYESHTTLMVNSSKGISAGDLAASFDLGSINLSQKLVVTYGVIVESRIVLEPVIERLNLGISYESLLRKITAQQVKSTEILKITVKDQDPEQAALIANTISDVFIKEVMRIMKVNNVEIIDAAIPINHPINVRTRLNIAISLVLGVMLGVFVAFLISYLDNTLKTEQDVEKYLQLPVIGIIPDTQQVTKG